jgi:hypothetical protein
VRGKAPADVKYPRLGQSRQRRDRFLGQTALAQPDHLPPTLLLCGRRQLAHIHMLHSLKLGWATAIFKISQAGSIY